MRRASALSLVGFAPWIAWWGTWFAAAVAGATAQRPPAGPSDISPPPLLDVLVPAHDEERDIGALLRSLGLPGDDPVRGRVLVVADHCTDRTADIARSLGAEVLERDLGEPGKPGALRDGLDRLARDPGRGAAVVLLDADCVCSDGFLERMARAFANGAGAAQAAYVMRSDAAGAVGGVALGVELRNRLRPTGLARLGLPVALSGSGIMLSWDALGRVRFGDHLAEDARISYDLLDAGIRTAFVPDALVVSPLPSGEEALAAQRRRWEGGQAELARHVPRVALRAVARGDVRGTVSLLDWSAPPLTAAAAGWAFVSVPLAALVAARRLPASALAGPAVAASLLSGYLLVGVAATRGPRGLREMVVDLARFAAWKARFYLRARRGDGRWLRTPRDG